MKSSLCESQVADSVSSEIFGAHALALMPYRMCGLSNTCVCAGVYIYIYKYTCTIDSNQMAQKNFKKCGGIGSVTPIGVQKKMEERT